MLAGNLFLALSTVDLVSQSVIKVRKVPRDEDAPGAWNGIDLGLPGLAEGSSQLSGCHLLLFP